MINGCWPRVFNVNSLIFFIAVDCCDYVNIHCRDMLRAEMKVEAQSS